MRRRRPANKSTTGFVAKHCSGIASARDRIVAEGIARRALAGERKRSCRPDAPEPRGFCSRRGNRPPPAAHRRCAPTLAVPRGGTSRGWGRFERAVPGADRADNGRRPEQDSTRSSAASATPSSGIVMLSAGRKRIERSPQLSASTCSRCSRRIESSRTAPAGRSNAHISPSPRTFDITSAWRAASVCSSPRNHSPTRAA